MNEKNGPRCDTWGTPGMVVWRPETKFPTRTLTDRSDTVTPTLPYSVKRYSTRQVLE